MSHPNARLTPLARLKLVRELEAGWPQAELARQFRVSRATVGKWWRRYRAEGEAGLIDRPSRPRRNARSVPPPLVRIICGLRIAENRGPHSIAWLLGIARSTVYAVLRRAGLNRLASLHRVTRQPVRRYEHPTPGDLLHLDVKKIGHMPDGGGKRFYPGFTETGAEPGSGQRVGFEYLHVAIDDHSRVAYVESLPDKKGHAAAAFLRRAIAYFKRLGVRIKRILTDNARNYTGHAVRNLARAYGVTHKRTRPYRPQTNGKAEAFNKILQREWAYARLHLSNAERLAALDAFLIYYNYHRPHGGIGGATPASRL